MQDVYNYISEKNFVSSYSAVAINGKLTVEICALLEHYAACSGNVISHAECFVHLH